VHCHKLMKRRFAGDARDCRFPSMRSSPKHPMALAIVAGAVVACMAVAGCSPGADYPTPFPAVHDMPPPRSDATLTPVQVQQATEDLITERNHLTSAAQSAGQKPTASANDGNPQPGRTPAASANGQTPAANSTVSAGNETK